jgi:two-component system cell cycle response regulator DivK
MILKGKRIFIVEDDLANRAIAQMLLEGEGARTAIDRWGKETVQRLEAFLPVDIILLDLMFPNDITGYDVFDHIRQNSVLAGIPIVAVSASDPIAAIAKTKEKGFDGFIPKPVSYALFAKQVLSVINGDKIWLNR